MQGALEFVAAVILAQSVSTVAIGCDRAALEAVAEADRPTRQHLLALRPCLADPDPAVRDGFAYTRYVEVLRSGAVAPDTLEQLLSVLLPGLSVSDADDAGFDAPFVALALAEVARADRVDRFLDANERDVLVNAAANYLGALRDYRGYIEGEGWRHGVAHAADLAMQLSLNPWLTEAQGQRLLRAIAQQVAPTSHHSYIFNEPGRLARPVFFLVTHQRVSEDALDAFFVSIAPDSEQARWQSPYTSAAGLAALHNTRAFAQALHVYAATSQYETAGSLRERAAALLRALP
ncbi:MAG: DUF2785 domain-containing protein [Pseudomonadota bacterium]